MGLYWKGVMLVMKIERVDDKTIKCFLTNEELEQYEIDYKDFIMRSDKAREVVQDIMTQAQEEVGFQPPKFAFDLQIMMIPEQGMLLTFQERDLSDLKNSEIMLGILKEMQRFIQQAKGQPGAVPEELAAMFGQGAGTVTPGLEDNAATNVQQEQKGMPATQGQASIPDFAVFGFRNLARVMEYASVLPKNLRVKSALYVMNDVYYLHLQKGGASYPRYSRACVQALEFGGLFAAEEDRLEYLREHGECLIAEHALKKMRLN